MEIEQYLESCAACGSRTIHFVIEPPDVRRHCAECGRDNSTTWGSDRLPVRPDPEIMKSWDGFVERLSKPRKPIECKPGTPAPVKPWDELSSFEKSQHFGPGALHE